MHIVLLIGTVYVTLLVGHKGNQRMLGSVLYCCHHLASGSPSCPTGPWDVWLTALVGFLLPQEVHLARAIPVQRCSLYQICALTSESREPQTSVILGNVHSPCLLCLNAALSVTLQRQKNGGY